MVVTAQKEKGRPQRALGRLCRQLGEPWKQFRGFSRLLRQLGVPQRQLRGVLTVSNGPT